MQYYTLLAAIAIECCFSIGHKDKEFSLFSGCYGFCQNGREPDELLPDLILATVSVIEMTNLATVPTNRNAFWQLSPKFRFF